MPQYDNTNRGVLFKGKKLEETHADYEGSINIDGQEYWLNAWIKRSEGKAPFMSLSVKPKQQQAPREKAMSGIRDMDDDIPF